MFTLNDKIYLVNEVLLKFIEANFVLIDQKDWYKLYKNLSDNSFWRLDVWDKYQEQFFIRLETSLNWFEFNDHELKIKWLKNSRGITNKTCIWKDCNKYSLKGILNCEFHAYTKMGIRK